MARKSRFIAAVAKVLQAGADEMYPFLRGAKEKNMRVRYVSILSAIFCFAPFAVAQSTFTLTAANPNGFYLGNNPDVYVSPYSATITGSSTNSGYVICDDFTDDVTLGESWTVDSSTIGTGGAANGMWDSGANLNAIYSLSGIIPSYSGAQGYNMVAYLADELLTNGNYNNEVAADALSYAIWTIFTPGAYSNISGDTVNGTNIQAAVVTDIQSAWANAGSGSDYNGPAVTVWTPTTWNTQQNGRPQEFLTIQTPEASALAYLAVDLTTVLGILFLVRRRILRGRREA
jgi:hypothetical protein